MKNPTNTFLASLASADLLLILLCLPVKVKSFFIAYSPFKDKFKHLFDLRNRKTTVNIYIL